MGYVETLSLETEGEVQILDVTAEVRRVVDASGVVSGLVTVFNTGSTGAVTTIEHEPGLVERDLPEALERWAPPHGEDVVLARGGEAVAERLEYGHEEMWQDGNGHSHVRASLLGPGLTVPVVAGEPTLGRWQQVVLVELDNKPRSRRVVVQVLGERDVTDGGT